MTEPVRLNEYDRIEWFDVARRLRPDLGEADFERMWADFCRMKEARADSAASKSNN